MFPDVTSAQFAQTNRDSFSSRVANPAESRLIYASAVAVLSNTVPNKFGLPPSHPYSSLLPLPLLFPSPLEVMDRQGDGVSFAPEIHLNAPLTFAPLPPISPYYQPHLQAVAIAKKASYFEGQVALRRNTR